MKSSTLAIVLLLIIGPSLSVLSILAQGFTQEFVLGNILYDAPFFIVSASAYFFTRQYGLKGMPGIFAPPVVFFLFLMTYLSFSGNLENVSGNQSGLAALIESFTVLIISLFAGVSGIIVRHLRKGQH